LYCIVLYCIVLNPDADAYPLAQVLNRTTITEFNCPNPWYSLYVYSVGTEVVFHGLWQARLAYSGSILGWSQFTLLATAPAASKKDAQFKNGQYQLENKQLALLI